MSLVRNRNLQYRAAWVILLGLLIGQQVFFLGADTRFVRALNNSLHTPWFMLVSLLVWVLVGKYSASSFSNKLGISAAICLSLGVLLELAQLLSARQASISDVGLNLLGSIAGFLIISSAWAAKQGRMVPGLMGAIVAMALLVAPFYSLWSIFHAEQERTRLAPVIIGFDSGSEALVETMKADWVLSTGPNNWPGFTGQSVALITLAPSQNWPGMQLVEPYSDWTSYSYLVLNTYSTSQHDIPFTVRVEAFSNDGRDLAIDFLIRPGANQHRFPIADLLQDRPYTNLKIKILHISSNTKYSGQHIYLGNVELQ